MHRLLFVDDEPFVLSALRRVLEPEGYEVVVATNPDDGLRALTGSGPFDLVCADYRMPGMNGATFLQRARELAPQASRMLLTALEEFDVAVDAINRAGVQRYLAKPWEPADLLAVVREACGECELKTTIAELTRVVHEKNRELERLNTALADAVAERTRSLLDGLVGALDYRDTETQWHSRRVAAFARRLARALGVDGDELAGIAQGALLHDIGKLGTPDAILLKPAPLTESEWSVMRRHAEHGYQLLRNVPYLHPARLVVLQHHERWDGRGYPQGLRGEEITLGARIFAVVDAFDAITSDRPYRRARAYAVARAEIERCAGTQFDPAVVRAFCAIPAGEWDAIRHEIARLADEDDARLAQDTLAIATEAPLLAG